jgi:hypothetical protein
MSVDHTDTKFEDLKETKETKDVKEVKDPVKVPVHKIGHELHLFHHEFHRIEQVLTGCDFFIKECHEKHEAIEGHDADKHRKFERLMKEAFKELREGKIDSARKLRKKAGKVARKIEEESHMDGDHMRKAHRYHHLGHLMTTPLRHIDLDTIDKMIDPEPDKEFASDSGSESGTGSGSSSDSGK